MTSEVYDYRLNDSKDGDKDLNMLEYNSNRSDAL